MNQINNISTAKKYYIDMLANELSLQKQQELNDFIEKNPHFRPELEILELIWKATDTQATPQQIPQMSSELTKKLEEAAKEEGEIIDFDFNKTDNTK